MNCILFVEKVNKMTKIYTCSCLQCGYTIQLKDIVKKTYEIEDETIHEFIKMYPDGFVDLDNNIYQCRKCKQISILPKLTMYINDNTRHHTYGLYKRYIHTCKKCHSKKIRIYGSRLDTQKRKNRIILKNGICPNCGAQLYIEYTQDD